MSYSQEKIQKLSEAIHGKKYDYSITKPVQNKLGKIQYICPIHGIQEQALSNHLQGKGCRLCANIKRRITKTPSKEEFLSKAKSKGINIDEYDFDNFNLLERDEKGRVTFICKKHGPYKDWPSNFLKGHGCHICYGHSKDDTEVQIQLSKLHPNLDFSQAKYSEKDKLNRLIVICPKHGIQHISYYNLLNGQGCYYCGREKARIKMITPNEECIQRGHEMFQDAYTYEKTDMYNRDSEGKITITCRKHGDFKILPSNFFKGVGCPKCQESSLEATMRLCLEQNRIDYIYQCSNKFLPWLEKQRIDFYLPVYNAAIECQGGQHFTPTTKFGGEEQFRKQILLDDLKRSRCQNNNVALFYYSTSLNIDFPYQVYTNPNSLIADIVYKKGGHI